MSDHARDHDLDGLGPSDVTDQFSTISHGLETLAADLGIAVLVGARVVVWSGLGHTAYQFGGLLDAVPPALAILGRRLIRRLGGGPSRLRRSVPRRGRRTGNR